MSGDFSRFSFTRIANWIWFDEKVRQLGNNGVSALIFLLTRTGSFIALSGTPDAILADWPTGDLKFMRRGMKQLLDVGILKGSARDGLWYFPNGLKYHVDYPDLARPEEKRRGLDWNRAVGWLNSVRKLPRVRTRFEIESVLKNYLFAHKSDLIRNGKTEEQVAKLLEEIENLSKPLPLGAGGRPPGQRRERRERLQTKEDLGGGGKAAPAIENVKRAPRLEVVPTPRPDLWPPFRSLVDALRTDGLEEEASAVATLGWPTAFDGKTMTIATESADAEHFDGELAKAIAEVADSLGLAVGWETAMTRSAPEEWDEAGCEWYLVNVVGLAPDPRPSSKVWRVFWDEARGFPPADIIASATTFRGEEYWQASQKNPEFRNWALAAFVCENVWPSRLPRRATKAPKRG